jgi:hypothetical protein
MDSDDKQILVRLSKTKGISQAYVVTTYSAVRHHGSHSDEQALTIRILDAGPDFQPSLRYICEVQADTGQFTCSKQSATPIQALEGIHWPILDRPTSPTPEPEEERELEEALNAVRRVLSKKHGREEKRPRK